MIKVSSVSPETSGPVTVIYTVVSPLALLPAVVGLAAAVVLTGVAVRLAVAAAGAARPGGLWLAVTIEWPIGFITKPLMNAWVCCDPSKNCASCVDRFS